MVLATRQIARAARELATVRADYARAVVDFCRLDRVGFDVKASNPLSNSSLAASLAPLAARDAFAGQRFVPHHGGSGWDVGIDGLWAAVSSSSGSEARENPASSSKSSCARQRATPPVCHSSCRPPWRTARPVRSIFVPLAYLPAEGALTTARLVEHLATQARNELGLPEVGREFFEGVLAAGAVVGLDALDECGSVTRRQQVRNLIVDVARKWPKCRIIVTSRIDAFALTPLPSASDSDTETSVPFAVYELAPFTRDDVAPFLKVAFDDQGPLAEEISKGPGSRL